MVRNDGFDYRGRVAPSESGETLLAHLSRRYPHSSATEWLDRIASGAVRVDGKPAAVEQTLRPGQAILWERPAWNEPEAPLEFAILQEDEDVLAVEKPAGLPTLPGAGFLHSTLLHQVRLHAPFAAPVHRLGRWTSGVVLFAKSAEARAGLAHQMASRDVRKRYRALASGLPAFDRLTIDRPIGPVPHPRLGSVHAASSAGRPAVSRITVIERRAGSFLCDVGIETGRPHQIRIHLASAGHALVGDPLYADGGIPAGDALPGDPGYLLHAAEVTYLHPVTGRRVTVESPPPSPLAGS